MTPQGRQRIGIFGGTFDPPQLGHISAAEQVANALSLDKVLFVPAGDPWQKSDVSSSQDRKQMVSLAIEGNPLFELSTVEIDREGPTYTVDTLQSLSVRYGDAELFFLMGDDAFAGIKTWKSWEKLPTFATLVVISRQGTYVDVPETLLASVNLCEVSALPISSTQCRELIHQGKSLEGLVPPAVAEYITEHRLYRSNA